MRLIAKDVRSQQMVKVTLRVPALDLTDENLCVPAYTHIGRSTVSGRLERRKSGYVFTRVN